MTSEPLRRIGDSTIDGRDRPATPFPRIGLVGIVLIGVSLVEAAVGALAGSVPAGHHGDPGVHAIAFIGMVLVFIGVLRGHRTAPGAGRGRDRRED